jgi:hypothetical protein
MALVVDTGDLHEGGILIWILGREAFLACCELVFCKWWLTNLLDCLLMCVGVIFGRMKPCYVNVMEHWNFGDIGTTD